MPAPVANQMAAPQAIDPSRRCAEQPEVASFKDVLDEVREKPALEERKAAPNETRGGADSSRGTKPAKSNPAQEQSGVDGEAPIQTPVATDESQLPIIEDDEISFAEVAEAVPTLLLQTPDSLQDLISPSTVASELTLASLLPSSEDEPRVDLRAHLALSLPTEPSAAQPVADGLSGLIELPTGEWQIAVEDLDAACVKSPIAPEQPSDDSLKIPAESDTKPAKSVPRGPVEPPARAPVVYRASTALSTPADAAESHQDAVRSEEAPKLESPAFEQLISAPHKTQTSAIQPSSSDVSILTPDSASAAPDVPTPHTHAPARADATGRPTPSTAREIEFAANNHDRLVSAIRAQLLPRGGSMQIRLDPPNLGTLEVAVRMQDGIMSISFQSSTDQATQLLSHSLTQLKHVLEGQGLAVDKIHVQQAPREHDASREDANQQQNLQDEASARQEQQRKEMLRRMWRRLALGSDPLDLVA